MKVIIDTNILISSIINPKGKELDIILIYKYLLDKYSCYSSFIELFKYKNKLIKASRLEENDLLEVIYRVIKKIKFISEEQILDKNWKKAISIAKDIDEYDTPFVALAIELNGLLWTGDKKLIKWLKNKYFNEIITTNEIIKIKF